MAKKDRVKAGRLVAEMLAKFKAWERLPEHSKQCVRFIRLRDGSRVSIGAALILLEHVRDVVQAIDGVSLAE